MSTEEMKKVKILLQTIKAREGLTNKRLAERLHLKKTTVDNASAERLQDTTSVINAVRAYMPEYLSEEKREKIDQYILLLRAEKNIIRRQIQGLQNRLDEINRAIKNTGFE